MGFLRMEEVHHTRYSLFIMGLTLQNISFRSQYFIDFSIFRLLLLDSSGLCNIRLLIQYCWFLFSLEHTLSSIQFYQEQIYSIFWITLQSQVSMHI